ncbi:hypothetical protein LTR53_008768 [Teratosphaeriaceae sp. CCFEE 6253]|nr:hypothetical protein LTR53_008768 [Teratosphaeriaceae sp. CCFEE 6253]
MAFQPLSVGDILMLSQTAWKIGRAFKQGKQSAPSQFAEVEREADGLSEALKLVAETLHADGDVLSQADDDTKTAVNTILESARKTLDDLESFVERYQVIKKEKTRGGIVVEKTWSEVVLANYKTFKWTTEGGGINDLRNMLQMHVNSINLVMQALQSRSLARLERTVMPMAENIADIHDRVNGDLGNKIDDLHRIIMALASSTPSLQARDRAIEGPGSTRSSSISTVSTFESPSAPVGTRMLEPPPARSNSQIIPMRQADQRASTQSSHSSKSTVTAVKQVREDSAIYSMGVLPLERDSRGIDWSSESGSPPRDLRSVVKYSPSDSPSPSSSLAARRRPSNIPRRESTTLPHLFNAISEDDAAAESGDLYPPAHATPPSTSSKASSSRNPHGTPLLPPPAVPPDGSADTYAATPTSLFSSPTRQRRSVFDDIPRPQTEQRSKRNSTDSINSPRDPEAPTFEKLLFRNAAILCDVRSTLVEYAQTMPDAPDPRYSTEMREACKESRVCVIRKREHRENGGTKVATSIWTISDDGAVRLQQKLSDINETVPYCSYFDPLKISLPPSEGSDSEIALKFHAEHWAAPLRDEKKTNWVNYVFAAENDAIAFQSAVFGRALLGSFRTTKTTVLHEGFRGAFAFEEQFANIEVLRLWEDDGIGTPGAAGGVLALMHVSSNFGEGWARWWMNSSKQQVRVREDGGRCARIKGIDVMVVKPGSVANTVAASDKIRGPASPGEGIQRVDTYAEPRPNCGRRVPVRAVTGVRVEFKTDEERARFVGQCKGVQEKMIPLPDL